jgi:hypothetical protein
VKAAQDWLDETPAMKGPPEMSYEDPEKLTAEEREERDWEIDRIVAEVDRAPREWPYDFHDPFRGGKVEPGGGIAEHAERMRRQLGLDVGREPEKVDIAGPHES